MQDLGVGAEFCLVRRLRSEMRITLRVLHEHATSADSERLVLGSERWSATCRAVRRAELQVVHWRDHPPRFVGDPPCHGGTTVVRPAVGCAEERAAVATNEGVEEIATLPVCRDAVGDADRANRLGGRILTESGRRVLAGR